MSEDPSTTLTDKELQQRQQAARTHGAHALAARGEEALDETGRSALAELREKVQTREGVLELMQERTAIACLIADVVTSYVSKEQQAGVPLTEIPIAKTLPAFYNTAGRLLKDLLAELPKGPQNLPELERIKKVVSDAA